MACTGPVDCWIENQAQIFKNIAESLVPVEAMLIGLAYVMGIAFAFKALYTLKVYGEARTMMSSNASIKEPLTYLFVAAVFIYFPAMLTILLTTTFGEPNIMAYDSTTAGTWFGLFSADSGVGPSLVIIIQVIGLIAFIRGWLIITRASSQGGQPGSTGKGWMHVMGGLLAINIVKTLEIINNTLYGT